MEQEFRKLLECNRSKFCNAVAADRLLSPLAVTHVLSAEDLQNIQNEPTNNRVNKLLDVLQCLDYNSFKKFCVVLETTYPYMLNCMFLGVEPPASFISRLEKDTQKKCGPRRVNVGRSTSMTVHDLCRNRYSLLKNELKAVKWDLDQAKSELLRAEKERDKACHQLAEYSGQKSVESIESSQPNSSSEDSSDYQRLKFEYVNVLTELQILRQQNSDLNEKHSIANQEADYFRRQHKTVLNKCDMLVREAQSLHHKLEESMRDSEKIRQDYEEIVLLREKEKFELKDRNVDRMSDRHECGEESFPADECNTPQKEYTQLQQTHRELRSEYNHIFNQLQSMEVNYCSIKEQFDKLNQEKDGLGAELNSAKQQKEMISNKLDRVIKEHGNILRTLQSVQEERDSALKDCDKIMNLQIKTARELAKVKEERNAVVNEYKLVMSERDNVHRETEKIQDCFHSLQNTNQFLLDEKDKLHQHNNTLQNEVNLLSSENDKLLGEEQVLREKWNSLLIDHNSVTEERDKAIDDMEMLKQERDAARRERSEALIHRDRILKECFKVKQKQDLVLKGEAKETDSLRKQFQMLSRELTAALHEADISRQRCEWALFERDKTLNEHKRLRNRHQSLQEKYNQSLADVTEMLHDSDQIRAQHNEIVMELVELKHHIQSILSSKGSERELLSSRDSAIDTDSTEWETESVIIEKLNHDNDVGIIIGGGRDTPLIPNDSSIVVTDITKGSIADGKLKVNDCLIKVNDLDLTNVEHQTAVQAIAESTKINLIVRRRRSSSVKSLRLTLGDGNELGIHVNESKFISFISPGSAAAKHPSLCVGDKIVTINGVSVENLTQEETERLLATSRVSLSIQKPKPTTPSNTLQSLLEEVNSKINCENDVYSHAYTHRKKLLLMENSHEIEGQHSARPKELYSEWSSPSLEEPSPLSDSMSGPLLQPFNDGMGEKSKGTQTDSNVASTDGYSETHTSIVEEKSTKVTHNSSTPQPQVSSPEKPLPPPRSCSFVPGLMSSMADPVINNSPQNSPYRLSQPKETYTLTMDTFSGETNHTYANPRLRGTRPQSAPSSRLQHLPYTSHLDPLALTTPKQHPSSTPASVSVLKSRTVPFYTASSYVIPRYNAPPAETQHCLPVHCMNSNSGSDIEMPVSKCSSGFIRGHALPTQHSRQGSSHSADEFELRHRRQQSLDSSHGPKLSNKMLSRMTLPGYQFSSQPCFPLGVSGGSVGSVSSGQVTPLQTPSTPIVPVVEGEMLAFDFNGHVSQTSTTEYREAEPRLVHIEKKDTLGISIAPGNNGGIFVCSVSSGSVAEKAGLKYGDQLLEYNGVNLRCANYEQAAKILKESGNSVIILAQFNPQRALEGDFDIGNSSVSESSTACSTPVNRRKVERDDSTITPPLPKDEKVVPVSDNEPPGDVRVVYLNHTSTNLGFNITGGNATGIFVAEVDANSEVAQVLNVGDQILEYDGQDMLSCTAEQALLEFCKSTGPIQALVQYNLSKFHSIKDQPGDSFHVRCLYDHVAHSKEELTFKQGDILYVTDTMYQGFIGCWRACLVSPDDAQQRDNGIVPSRMKAEQEILLNRSLAAVDHRFSGRRSLFRRSKKSAYSLTISHSRDGSDSAASITSVSELGLVSYQTVDKLDSHIRRPVVLLGPLAETFCEKLANDFPYKFVYCKSEFVNLSLEMVDKCISEGTFVDYAWKGGHLACTSLSSIKTITDKHPLLVVKPEAIERLNALQVYPIVLFIKFKSYKAIKELKDSNKYLQDRITSKGAKEMFERAQRLEKDFKPIFNAIVNGHSFSHICTSIQESVNDQQKKTIWVPLTSI